MNDDAAASRGPSGPSQDAPAPSDPTPPDIGTAAAVPTDPTAQMPAAAGADAVDRKLEWRYGKIDLAGETLGEAVADFNRYNDRKIEVADPRLADERFVGWFRTNDPEGFAEAAATTFNGKVSLRDDAIVLRGG